MQSVDLAGITVEAVSVGGMETCIGVPSWKLCFDIGRCPPAAVKWGRVFFTHTHVDHAGGVVHHASLRKLLGRTPPEYYVPEEVREPFEEMIQAWRRLSRSELPCVIHGVSPGDRIPLGPGREVVVFRAIHRIPTVGYALVQTPTARPRGRSPEVLADPPAPEVVLAFCGDTTADIIDREPLVREARALVMEVTYVGAEVSPERARELGHVHFDELVSRLDLLGAERILCTHPSARYGPTFAARIAQCTPRDDRARLIALTAPEEWRRV